MEAVTLQDWIAPYLRDPEAQWSAGSYGAIAEFSREAAEPPTSSALSLAAGVRWLAAEFALNSGTRFGRSLTN